MIITGAIKTQGLLDITCFKDVPDLLQALSQYLTIEIPDSITNVVVSNVQPTDPSRNVIWFKQSAAGQFVGIQVYSGGSWVQLFPVVGQTTLVKGDSGNPPTGYKVVTDDDVTSPELTHLQTMWYPAADPVGPWTIFHVIYSGL